MLKQDVFSRFFRKSGQKCKLFKYSYKLIFFSFKKRVVFKVKQTYIEVAIDRCP